MTDGDGVLLGGLVALGVGIGVSVVGGVALREMLGVVGGLSEMRGVLIGVLEGYVVFGGRGV